MQLKIITTTFFVLMAVVLTMATSSTTTLAKTDSSTPLPTATVSTIALQDTTVKLRERLQRILGDQDENTAGKQVKAAYIGQVTRVSDEAITLKTLVGTEIIPLESSIVLLKRTQQIPVTEVAVGNWLIVIGTREKNQAIRPKLLLLQTVDLKPREHLVAIGVVTGTSATSITLIPRGKTEPLTLTVTKNSKLIDAVDEKMTIKTVPKDVSAIVVGFASVNGWELGTLKTTVSMAEYKSATSPTPKPTVVPKKSSPKPSAASTQ